MEERRSTTAQGLSDVELAVGMQAGDAEALGALYDRHVQGIHDFLARFTRDPAAAEDLVHSTFLRAWERRATLRDPSKVRAWLYATAHNLALNHVTRARHADSIDDEGGAGIADAARGPEEEALARDAADLVWTAAASLEERQYAVLDLSVRRGLTTREIADVLGVPTGHAAVLANRAREALGNAVRYLLVARRRDHCERLAALVPEGTRALTGVQRSAVDHHMRRCASCQDLGRRLTSPAELLGALLPLPLPEGLGEQGRQRLVAAVRAQPQWLGGFGPPWPPPRPRWWEGRRRWAAALAVLALLLLVGGGTTAYLTRPAQSVATLPGAAPQPSATGSLAEEATPTPAATPVMVAATPTPTATATPTPTPSPPPLVVRAVRVTWDDLRTCPPDAPPLQGRTCHFTVTVAVDNANGRDTVAGTLTLTLVTGAQTTVGFKLVPPAGATVVTAMLAPHFNTCPSGSAVAATTVPNAVSSQKIAFGAC